MSDRYENLRALGESAARNKELYRYEYPDPTLLETFPAPEGIHEVILRNEAWTGLCPKTGQPDQGVIVITYEPNDWLVESKSLKLYMMGFRQHGAFGEQVVSRIRQDLEKVLAPKFINVHGTFAARGDIAIDAKSIGGSRLDFTQSD